jgi:netrin receptor unc-5
VWVFVIAFGITDQQFLISLILFTDLKKYFEQAPYSKNVEVGSQTEMRCIPPDGVPTTVISWIRDGQIIDPKRDPNYIITADGHLLIAQTRLSDMGNYSCVAENIASRRVSEPSLLTVYGKLIML